MTVTEWVTPRFRPTGGIIEVETWNQDVVDNSRYLHAPPHGWVRDLGAGAQIVAYTNFVRAEWVQAQFRADNDDMITDEPIDRVTCNHGGLYLVFGSFQASTVLGTATIDHTGYLVTNSGSVIASHTLSTTNAGGTIYNEQVSLAGMAVLSAGDYVQMAMNNGTTGISMGYQALSMHWLGGGGSVRWR